MNAQQREAWLSWEKFLNPQTLKQNLVEASIFISAYEILKNSVETRLRGFYCIGAEEGKESVAYKRKVKELHKDRLHASLLWFKQNGAIDDLDLEAADIIRQHRNSIAHELPNFVALHGIQVNRELILRLSDLVAKVDRWWIRNCDPPVDDNLEDVDLSALPDNEIQSGNMMMLHLMLTVFDGDESLLRELHNAVMKPERKT